MSKVNISDEERDQFEYYLFEMDEVLDAFIKEASRDGYQLDFKLESLATLEALLLQSLDKEEEYELNINRAARYLGEAFRKNVGGTWELCLKDPKYLFFKLPVVSGFSDLKIEFCPIEIVRNFMLSKRSGLLRNAVESNLEFKK